MVSSAPSLRDFEALPRKVQIEHLLTKGQLIPGPQPDELCYYRVGDFYARVLIDLDPLQVREVVAFRDGPLFEQMLEVVDLRSASR